LAATGPWNDIALMCVPTERRLGTASDARLPGFDLMTCGIADLAVGTVSVESLLVSIGAPRLRTLGFAIPTPFADAETRLFVLLTQQYADGAHSRYNGLVRRLVSFQRAAACAR